MSTSSNSKFRNTKEAPTEPFKRSVASCLLAMLVRERLTGMAPPTAARKVVDLWRPILEDKIGKRLDRLDSVVEDQTRFGDAVHDLLTALELGDERSADSEDNDDQDENRDG